MFLALDVGNTNITVGLFGTRDGKVLPGPLKIWRMFTRKRWTSDEYAVMLINMLFYSGFDAKEVTNIAVSSVIPQLNDVFRELFKKYFDKEIFFVSCDNCGGLVFSAENSKETGADRIANVVAAYSFYNEEEGCIVVDFGTATTFDCINCTGEYLGGAIVMGPSILMQSLSLKTSQLPNIVEIKKPLRSVGFSTFECIQSGTYFGYVGLVKELIIRMKKEVKVKHVIATGGLAGLISNDVKEIETVLPDLTLEGIRIIWGKSVKSDK
ncbi:MAG: type III pantothenate kinase [Endomicrobium sp.]|jgi:type III pantothenate kinase|nr:type III pantothenate kinase [Endomicrobium sp.]